MEQNEYSKFFDHPALVQMSKPSGGIFTLTALSALCLLSIVALIWVIAQEGKIAFIIILAGVTIALLGLVLIAIGKRRKLRGQHQ